MNSNKINLNTISKVAFETNYGKKQSYSLSQLNDIDDLCSTNIKYNIEEHINNLYDKNIIKDMLINILSICYIQNIDLNDIFKMEVKHYEEV